MTRELTRIGQVARKDEKAKFTSIYHFVTDVDHLRASYEEIETGKAPGVDGVTKEEYGEQLEENLQELSNRLGRHGYKPKPVKRAYIPKPGSKKKRPLGIPTIACRVNQEILRMTLEPIVEYHFSERSFGFRPKRSCHDAIKDLFGKLCQRGSCEWIVEGDIRSCFDNLSHSHILHTLQEWHVPQWTREVIQRMMKSQLFHEGHLTDNNTGTPQGSVRAP